MTKLLIRLFIRNYKKTEDTTVRQHYGILAGVVGIISNLLLSSVKILIGLISGSIAILADGINNLSDASSSIITLIGFKLAAMPEDKGHPYGHARFEYLAGLFIAVIIMIVGFFLLRSSIEEIIHPKPLDFNYITIVTLALAILAKLWMMKFYIYLGKQISSVTLITAGYDSRNDVAATAAVLIGVIISRFAGINIDGYLGCTVALFILWSGVQSIIQTVNPLLGEAPDEKLVEKIAEIAKGYKGVLGIHDLELHSYGPGKTFASMHIEVDAAADIMESHEMIDNIERDIGEMLNISFVAHMDPVRLNDPVLMQIKGTIQKTIESINGIKGIHDLRTAPCATHTNILFDLVLEPNCELPNEEIKNTIETEVQKLNPRYYIVITFDKAYTDV